VPWRLRNAFPEHEVSGVAKLGWADLPDGELLNAMGSRFDVLVTVDKNLRFQQDLRMRPFAVAVLCAKSNHIRDLPPLVPELLAALPTLSPGEVTEFQAWPGRI
jgi:hypothetical protein